MIADRSLLQVDPAHRMVISSPSLRFAYMRCESLRRVRVLAVAVRSAVSVPLRMVEVVGKEAGKVGAVSESRYEEIVAELRGAIEEWTREQFTVGDRALEVEPLCPRSSPAGESAGPEQLLSRLARDIGLPVSALREARWTASRWPVEKRRRAESFAVHGVLAGIEDAGDRFAAIDDVPEGKTHWTVEDARRRAGFDSEDAAGRSGEGRQ
ncbi:DUF6192 family protein [Streptomyces fagopyri]